MFGALLGVGASIVGSVLGNKSQKKAASQAQQSQENMSREAIEEQRRQFDAMQKLLNPYVQAGGDKIAVNPFNIDHSAQVSISHLR